MKTKLDQISIPPLDNGMSEIAHTLVCMCVYSLTMVGSIPSGVSLQDPWQDHDTFKRKFFGFLVFFALILSPLLGSPENARVM